MELAFRPDLQPQSILDKFETQCCLIEINLLLEISSIRTYSVRPIANTPNNKKKPFGGSSILQKIKC